jgi:hypothetical protein
LSPSSAAANDAEIGCANAEVAPLRIDPAAAATAEHCKKSRRENKSAFMAKSFKEEGGLGWDMTEKLVGGPWSSRGKRQTHSERALIYQERTVRI